jgi:hypothetical protein
MCHPRRDATCGSGYACASRLPSSCDRQWRGADLNFPLRGQRAWGERRVREPRELESLERGHVFALSASARDDADYVGWEALDEGTGLSRLSNDARNGSAPHERMSSVAVSWIAAVSRPADAAGQSVRNERSQMATKDKNSKKSMEKKPPQKTLKEKRQAKRGKTSAAG